MTDINAVAATVELTVTLVELQLGIAYGKTDAGAQYAMSRKWLGGMPFDDLRSGLRLVADVNAHNCVVTARPAP